VEENVVFEIRIGRGAMVEIQIETPWIKSRVQRCPD
jgi:hypothetical protein